MRIVFLALFSLATGVASATSHLPIQVDQPGVLDSIRTERPDHYRRITGILEAAERMPCHTPHFGRAAIEYQARQAHCGLMLLTSYPARRRLSFRLDDVPYVALVTMRDSYGRFMRVPATAGR